MTRLALLLSLSVVVFGCNPTVEDVDAGTDAGGLFDAGVGFDAGVDAGADAGPAQDAGADAGQSDAGLVTTVRVHYPMPSGTLSVRGSALPLTWTTGLAMTRVSADVHEFKATGLTAPLEFKPLQGDTTWSRGPNFVVAPGATVDVYPHFSQVQGTWSRRWPTFTSTLLSNTRAVWVYLPPTAVENPLARFPVVYMLDGQNLFDPAYAFGGQTWKVPEACDAAAENGYFAEAIIVGVDNGGGARIAEYTPTVDPGYGGGNGDLYLRMMVEELKPMVDGALPTLPGRDSTVLMGSSLGGLLSSYAGFKHPGVFGRIGAFSPSTWWDNRVLLTYIGQTPAAPNRPVRVYVDSGDSGNSQDGLTDTAALAQKYRDVGYVEGLNFTYVVEAGGTHTETAWARRLPHALRALLGPMR